jgi:hypothetical protein
MIPEQWARSLERRAEVKYTGDVEVLLIGPILELDLTLLSLVSSSENAHPSSFFEL